MSCAEHSARILIPIAATAVYSSVQHQARTWSSKWKLATTCLGLVIFTGIFITKFQGGLVGSAFFQLNTMPFPECLDYMNALVVKYDIAQEWFELIPLIMNDAFIIWHAWVVFKQRCWAMYISIGLFLSTLAVALAYLGINSKPDVRLTASLSNSEVSYFLYLATTILSFVTNLVATSFIGQTLQVHLKFLHSNMDNKQCQSFQLWQIVLLLVDAGAVYGVLQLLNIITSLAVKPDQFAAAIFSDVIGTIYLSISPVYPAFTIALIHGPFSIVGVHQTVNSLQISSLAVWLDAPQQPNLLKVFHIVIASHAMYLLSAFGFCDSHILCPLLI
ncbi:hypothetical protein H2248_001910 [Termitomyces sp. 'cryptogamus']|nr:hypothetical protein H2248_001910 [Termitomyces sp. 'cryptogamus']